VDLPPCPVYSIGGLAMVAKRRETLCKLPFGFPNQQARGPTRPDALHRCERDANDRMQLVKAQRCGLLWASEDQLNFSGPQAIF
jgi:hypothetical protein